MMILQYDNYLVASIRCTWMRRRRRISWGSRSPYRHGTVGPVPWSLNKNMDLIWSCMIWKDIMIWYDMKWCEMIWYDVIWDDMIQCDMIGNENDIMWYYIRWYDMKPKNIIWCVMIWKETKWCDMVCYEIIWHELWNDIIQYDAT
jgi:hypothetical protein